MGIRQQVRVDAPHPEVRETDYGATFVKAATERPAEPVMQEAPAEEEVTVTADDSSLAAVAEAAKPAGAKPVAAKKKGGRPKKQK